jgi:NADH-quinone oxidoreductase subunit C
MNSKLMEVLDPETKRMITNEAHIRRFHYLTEVYGPAFCGRMNALAYNTDQLANIVNCGREELGNLAELLASDSMLRATQLLDVVGIDRPLLQRRFQLVHYLLSPEMELRIAIRTALLKDEPVDSLAGTYLSAPWLERECWDLLGIPFTDHPDLRRILTNYGFEGYPLRKDFPLSGYCQVRYDEDAKAVVEEPVALTQEFRYFDFLSPWSDSAVFPDSAGSPDSVVFPADSVATK